MRDATGDFAECAQPLGLELAFPRGGEGGSQLAQRLSQRFEFGRATAERATGGGKGLMPPDQGRPTDQLVDGAGELLIFRAIVLRLVAPGMVTVALLSFVGTWNNYFLPLIVLRSQEYQPITVGLATWYQLAQQGGGGGQVLFSIIITGALVSIIPVIVVFLLLQRFWQGGLTAGAIK